MVVQAVTFCSHAMHRLRLVAPAGMSASRRHTEHTLKQCLGRSAAMPVALPPSHMRSDASAEHAARALWTRSTQHGVSEGRKPDCALRVEPLPPTEDVVLGLESGGSTSSTIESREADVETPAQRSPTAPAFLRRRTTSGGSIGAGSSAGAAPATAAAGRRLEGVRFSRLSPEVEALFFGDDGDSDGASTFPDVPAPDELLHLSGAGVATGAAAAAATPASILADPVALAMAARGDGGGVAARAAPCVNTGGDTPLATDCHWWCTLWLERHA
jgi:hypothetical protein